MEFMVVTHYITHDSAEKSSPHHPFKYKYSLQINVCDVVSPRSLLTWFMA